MANYNGWKNYETWNIALWLGNDCDSFIREMAKESQDDVDLADKIENFITENNPLPATQASLYQDILGASLRSADYREIARFFLEDLES